MERATEPGERSPRTDGREGGEALWAHVEKALRGLRFGTVTLTVQDGVVVQVERTEKIRLPRGASNP
jgi:hypothetical protein